MNLRMAVPVLALLTLALAGCTYTPTPLKGSSNIVAMIGQDGAPNGGVIATSKGAVVIDPGLSPETGAVFNQEAKSRSSKLWDEIYRSKKREAETLPPPVLYVLNTTYRASHTFGNEAFASQADLVMSNGAARKFGDTDEFRRMREIMGNQFKVPGAGNAAMSDVVMSFEGSFSLRTPEVELKMISMGDCVGEGDAVVYLPQQKILFAGDIVIPGFVPYYKGRTPTIQNWIQALKRLKLMDIDTIIPGHGKIGGKELIDQQLEFLEALKVETTVAIQARQTPEQAAASVKLVKFNTWRGFNEWMGENVKLMYQELSQGAGTQGAASHPEGGAAVAGPRNGLDGRDVFADK